MTTQQTPDASPAAKKTYEQTADGRTIVPLREPITFGKETVSALHLRRVKAKDLRGIPLDGTRTVGHILEVLSQISGLAPVVIGELGAEDLEEVSSIVGGF